MKIRKSSLLLPVLLLSAAAAHAQTHVPDYAQTPGLQWHASGAAQYICGGISDEGMSAIKSLRDEANGELLLTGGPQGAYLANVVVTIQGRHLQPPLNFTADGPVCLLKLPKGRYVVNASYKGVALKRNLDINGSRHTTQLRWATY